MLSSRCVREVTAGTTRLAAAGRKVGTPRAATAVCERREARYGTLSQRNVRGNNLCVMAAAPETAEVETERSQLRIKLKCYSIEPLQVCFPCSLGTLEKACSSKVCKLFPFFLPVFADVVCFTGSC